MKTSFATSWKGSSQPRRQRKYLYHAPEHLRKAFMSSHLSKELRQKYNKRSIPIRVGDKVKVLRGQFEGTLGKVNAVNRSTVRIYIEGVELVKNDGSKKPYPIHPSNVLIIDLDTSDKKRIAKAKTSAKKETTTAKTTNGASVAPKKQVEQKVEQNK